MLNEWKVAQRRVVGAVPKKSGPRENLLTAGVFRGDQGKFSDPRGENASADVGGCGGTNIENDSEEEDYVGGLRKRVIVALNCETILAGRNIGRSRKASGSSFVKRGEVEPAGSAGRRPTHIKRGGTRVSGSKNKQTLTKKKTLFKVVVPEARGESRSGDS